MVLARVFIMHQLFVLYFVAKDMILKRTENNSHMKQLLNARMKEYVKLPVEERIKLHAEQPISEWFRQITTPAQIQQSYTLRETAKVLGRSLFYVNNKVNDGTILAFPVKCGSRVEYGEIRHQMVSELMWLDRQQVVEVVNSRLEQYKIRWNPTTVDRYVDEYGVRKNGTGSGTGFYAPDVMGMVSSEEKFFRTHIDTREFEKMIGKRPEYLDRYIKAKRIPAKFRYGQSWIARSFAEKVLLEQRTCLLISEALVWMQERGLVAKNTDEASLIERFEVRGIPMAKNSLGKTIVTKAALEGYYQHVLDEPKKKKALLASIGIKEGHPAFDTNIGIPLPIVSRKVQMLLDAGVTDVSHIKVSMSYWKPAEKFVPAQVRKTQRRDGISEFRKLWGGPEDKKRIAAIRNHVVEVSAADFNYLVVGAARGSSAALMKLAEICRGEMKWAASRVGWQIPFHEKMDVCLRGLWRGCCGASVEIVRMRSFLLQWMLREVTGHFRENTPKREHVTYDDGWLAHNPQVEDFAALAEEFAIVGKKNGNSKRALADFEVGLN